MAQDATDYRSWLGYAPYQPLLVTVVHFVLSADTVEARHCGKCRICQKGFEVGDEVTFVKVVRGRSIRMRHLRYEHKRCWEKQRDDYLVNGA